jgi:hypothetical protein
VAHPFRALDAASVGGSVLRGLSRPRTRPASPPCTDLPDSGNRFGASVRAAVTASVRNGSPRRAARSPFPIAEWSPQKRKCVTQITDGRGAASYIGNNRTHTLEEGEHVMTWTSDRAGVVLYTVLGMLIVLSSIYIPA